MTWCKIECRRSTYNWRSCHQPDFVTGLIFSCLLHEITQDLHELCTSLLLLPDWSPDDCMMQCTVFFASPRLHRCPYRTVRALFESALWELEVSCRRMIGCRGLLQSMVLVTTVQTAKFPQFYYHEKVIKRECGVEEKRNSYSTSESTVNEIHTFHVQTTTCIDFAELKIYMCYTMHKLNRRDDSRTLNWIST